MPHIRSIYYNKAVSVAITDPKKQKLPLSRIHKRKFPCLEEGDYIQMKAHGGIFIFLLVLITQNLASMGKK